MISLVTGFIVCTAAIVLAGINLSRYADVLAEKTGLGRGWVGMTAVGIATSLPELSAGISSVTYAGSVNIALGDALGSCIFNLAIIALVDLMTKDEPVLYKAGPGNMLAAGFGVVMLATALLALLVQPLTGAALYHISVFSLAMLPVYFVASRLIYMYEKREMAKFIHAEAETLRYEGVSLKKTVTVLALCALTVAVAGTFLPKVGVSLADATGLGKGFVGSVLIALSTSLPEVVVSITAVRIGAPDIAIGNLLGSNIFNCVIIAIDDLAYTKGPLFTEAAPSQAITAGIALVMTGVVLIGLIYRSSQKAFLKLGWESYALTGLYALNVLLSYKFGGGH